MNDIKILREFAKINSCCEDLKAVNKLEKVCLIYWIIGNRKAFCVAEREGFEPSVRLPAHVISSHAPSATRSSLRSRNSPPKNRFSEQPILTNDTYPCKLFAKLSSHLEIPSRSLACDTFTGFVC